MSETRTQYNAEIIGEFRANQGRVGGAWEAIPLLLLHHTGAKSGVSRVNPVAYLPSAAAPLQDSNRALPAARRSREQDPARHPHVPPHTRRERVNHSSAQTAQLSRPTNDRMEAAMNHEPNRPRPTEAHVTDSVERPVVVDRDTFQAELDALLIREKAHTREGDAIAAVRRRLPMVEMDPSLPLIGPRGPLTLLDAFEGRRQLIAYYFMWWNGHPAAEQCEGCTHYTTQVGELSYLHSNDVTYATFCQGPYEESIRYRDFMGWQMPWYSAEDSLDALLTGRDVGKMHLVCYLRDAGRVFETYWTTRRGVEAMDYSYGLLDLTVYGRQESWEDSPAGWPQSPVMSHLRTNGRPTAQWSRLQAGRCDDLGTTGP